MAKTTPNAAPLETPKTRKHLSADALYALVREGFEEIPDHRDPKKVRFPLADALMSAFAMFSLKDPSLLAFEARRNDGNMKRLFRIGEIPSDTGMRETLDDVDPETLRFQFKRVIHQLQRGKALEKFAFLDGHFLLSMDGTGHFSSKKVHCPSCMEKVNSTTGEVTYHHQMLGAVLVHPDLKEVIPIGVEPIVKQDGATKNDCERNAGKRLLAKIRADHPKMKFIVVEDALASNAPHIREIQKHGMRFLLGVKPADHRFLFDRVIEANSAGRATTLTKRRGDVRCEIVYVKNVPLNESNQDLRVNYIEYLEYDADGNAIKNFSWVTDLAITAVLAWLIVAGGRCRWKVENETFNTLKNQGYHYEHNYGHGVNNLCTVFMMLMMLAFLVDQTQQLCCPLFRACWTKLGSKRALWEQLRSHFYHFAFDSMKQLYEAMLYDLAKEVPLPQQRQRPPPGASPAS